MCTKSVKGGGGGLGFFPSLTAHRLSNQILSTVNFLVKVRGCAHVNKLNSIQKNPPHLPNTKRPNLGREVKLTFALNHVNYL